MKNKIFIIAPIILAAIIVVVWIALGVTKPPTPPDDETQPVETEEYYVPPIVGDTEISEERQPLLDENIIDLIENADKQIPKLDENGNIITDENGNIVTESVEMPDYTNVKGNIIVIVNEFADRGYSEEAIALVQRFYFRYYDRLGEYTSDELIDKLTYCFSKSDNTPSELSRKITSTFGLYREDKFAFLFEESLSSSETKVLFFEVKPYSDYSCAGKIEIDCLYSEWFTENGDAVHDRNLEAYLHTIAYKMNEANATEFDIRLAQLLYCAFVADTEYRADGIDLLTNTVTANSENFDLLRESLLESFGVDISSNRIISAYYKGVTEFNEGGEG